MEHIEVEVPHGAKITDDPAGHPAAGRACQRWRLHDGLGKNGDGSLELRLE